MSNVQLGRGEAVRVFTEADTGRILGMVPAGVKTPLFTVGIRWRSEVLYHVFEIESTLRKWREQVKQEAFIRTERQAKRDAIFRNSLASALRALNVDEWNREQNNKALAAMDKKNDEKIKAQLEPKLYGVAEAYEASANSHEIAQDSPYFSHGPEKLSSGGAVDNGQ